MQRLSAIAGAVLLLGAGPPPAAERVVAGDATMPASVNGVPLRLHIDPGAFGLMIVGPDVAQRARLKGGLLGIGMTLAVGPQRVEGISGVARVGLDGRRPGKRRIGWARLPFAVNAEAVIGPAGLDEPVVRFVLRAPAAGERTVVLPMAPHGGLFGQWNGLRGLLTLRGAPLFVRFDPHQRRSTVTAITAQRLADEYGGRLEGAAEPVVVAFGIERPVRRMRLARGWPIGPLSIDAVGVRIADPVRDGAAAPALPEAGAPPPPRADPDEVVVTARPGKKPRAGLLVLGADLLDRCSTLVFDKPAATITLSCS